jgi:hypothetical protein
MYELGHVAIVLLTSYNVVNGVCSFRVKRAKKVRLVMKGETGQCR